MTAVKWDGVVSEPFEIQQGVRHGGVLSTDFYKVYQNGSLDRLAVTKRGYYIG